MADHDVRHVGSVVEGSQEFVCINEFRVAVGYHFRNRFHFSGLLRLERADGDIRVLQINTGITDTTCMSIFKWRCVTVTVYLCLTVHLKYCLHFSSKANATGPLSRPATNNAA